MGAASGQMPVVQHQNLIRLLDAGNALGHQEGGHGIAQIFDGFSQRRIGGKVQGAGAVIQNKDFRLLHQRTGNGKPLLLAAGQVPSALFQLEVQLTGLALHDLLGLGSGQRLPQLLIRGIFIAPVEVVTNGALEQHRPLLHHAHLVAQRLPALPLDVFAVQADRSLLGVIEAGNQADQGGLAAARAADDADGLPLPCLEADVCQAGRTGIAIGKGHMVEADRVFAVAASLRSSARILHAGLLFQHRAHTTGAGQGLGQGDNQGGQLDELHNDLQHVVVQRHHITLGNVADVHLDGRPVNEEHRRNVDKHIGQGVQQGGNPAHELVELGQCLVAGIELLHGLLLPAEGPDDPHAGEVFPGQAGHCVQSRLGLFEQGDAHQHDGKHHHQQHRDGRRENQGALGIDGKSHDERAEHHKGTAQQQPQTHVHAGLHLVDVGGQAGNHGVRPQGVQFGEGKLLDVVKHRLPQVGGKARAGTGGKELSRNAARQAQQRHANQDEKALGQNAAVIAPHADVDHPRHNQGHQQVEHHFQQLEQRGQDALRRVPFQVDG